MSLPSIHYLSDRDHTGYGVAARRLVLGLEELGCPIAWTPITWNHRDPLDIDGERDLVGLGRLEGVPIEPDVMIVHATPEMAVLLERLRPPGVPLVVHTVWEHQRLQAHWPESLNRFDAVVVPTQWNAAAFVAAGVTVPIVVVPHAHAHRSPGPDWPDPFDDGSLLFHSIAVWSVRKNPGRVVEAFARAFGPADRVRLLLRTGPLLESDVRLPPGPPDRQRQSSWSVAGALARYAPPPAVHLVTDRQSDAWVAGLHARSDCWISLPHSEGWDLGCFDAAVAGCPVITSGYGAVLEYLDPECSRLIPGVEVPHPYLPDTWWLDPDVDAAVEVLRAVHADPQAARAQAVAQAEVLRARYAPAVVAAQLIEGLAGAGLISRVLAPTPPR